MNDCQNQASGCGADAGDSVPACKAAVHQRRLGNDAMVVAQTVWMTLEAPFWKLSEEMLKRLQFLSRKGTAGDREQDRHCGRIQQYSSHDRKLGPSGGQTLEQKGL